jgi:hypothetical protein
MDISCGGSPTTVPSPTCCSGSYTSVNPPLSFFLLNVIEGAVAIAPVEEDAIVIVDGATIDMVACGMAEGDICGTSTAVITGNGGGGGGSIGPPPSPGGSGTIIGGGGGGTIIIMPPPPCPMIPIFIIIIIMGGCGGGSGGKDGGGSSIQSSSS